MRCKNASRVFAYRLMPTAMLTNHVTRPLISFTTYPDSFDSRLEMLLRHISRPLSAVLFRTTSLLTLVGSMSLAGIVGASAQSVDYAGYDWEVDRYAPDEFGGIGSYAGQNNVLRILIGEEGFTENRPYGYQEDFRNKQGRYAALGFVPGASFATADLYIPSSWQDAQSSTFQEAGLWLWVEGTDSSRQPEWFPTVDFSNHDSEGHFIAWDGNVNNTLSTPVNYDAWNTLRIEVHGDRWKYYINGELALVDDDIYDDDNAALQELVLQSVNNNVEAYEVFWSNVMAGYLATSEDAINITAGPSDLGTYNQLMMLGDFSSRRGVQPFGTFEPQNDVWGRVGGFGGAFDMNGTSVDSTGGFVQGGVDLYETGTGFAFGVSGQYGASSGDAGASGSSTSQSLGVGVYGNYHTDSYFIDMNAMVSFENWDLTTSLGSGATDATSLLASVEAGFALDLSESVRLVPNAQLTYLTRDIDDLAIGGVTTSYETQQQLVARAGARLETLLPLGQSARGYVSASVIGSLANDGAAVATGPSLPGGNAITVANGFDGVLADLSAGVDIQLSDTTRLFAQVGGQFGSDVEIFQVNAGVAFKF